MKAKITEKIHNHYMLSMCLLAVLINLIIEFLSRKSVLSLLKFVFLSPHIFLYNCAVIWLTLTVSFLVKRKLFAAALVSIVWLLFGITNSILLVFRTTPFTAVDFRLIKYALGLADSYFSWLQLVLLGVGAVLLLIGCVFLFRILPKWQERVNYPRVLASIAVLTLALYGITTIGMKTGILATNFGNLQEAYHQYGFAYCFGNSLLNTGISKPDTYSRETIDAIAKKEILPMESTEAEDPGQTETQEPASAGTEASQEPVIHEPEKKEQATPNIIFLQLESFFDPTTVKDLTFSEDPIPYFRELMGRYSSGSLNVPSVGAGTANTEFEVITGMNLDFFGPGEYPYKTVLKEVTCESVSYDLKTLGYAAHAIHNNEGTFYDRHLVFSQLGFDSFTPIEYMDNYERNPTGWVKDEILTNEILDTLRVTEGADFIYTISVQGHGAYPTEEVITDPGKITVEGYDSEESMYQMEYYANQIHEMDAFVKTLTDKLAALDEKTVLVLYGDHLPSLNLSEEMLSNENLFQTPYIIWSNYDLEKADADVEAYQLAAHVLKKMDFSVGSMIRYHQYYLSQELDGEQQETYLENMKLLEYDLLYGDKEVIDGTTFQPTNLQMGIHPISISLIKQKQQTTYIYGKNFNSYSKVFLNDEPLDTVFVFDNLLVVKDASLSEDGENIFSVRQVGRDNVTLSQTPDYYYQITAGAASNQTRSTSE